jgi:hypothetical protein
MFLLSFSSRFSLYSSDVSCIRNPGPLCRARLARPRAVTEELDEIVP